MSNTPDYPTLKKILKQETGKDFSDEQVKVIGRWLIRLYRHLERKN